MENVTRDTSGTLITKTMSTNVPADTIHVKSTLPVDISTNGHLYYYNYTFYEYDYGDELLYPKYVFESTVYLCVWNILVIITCLMNIMVVSILLRRKMRNTTNSLLAAISVSDSMTGLVSLPTYNLIYWRYEQYDTSYNDYEYFDYENQTIDSYFETNIFNYDIGEVEEPITGIGMDKNLCHGFLISKHFLSPSFHTVSIFLTLYLGIQRYVCVAFPFKSKHIFSVRKIIVSFGLICALSPVLHLYNIIIRLSTEYGLCATLYEDTSSCTGYCIYMWFNVLIGHIIPCVMLLIFTVLFIRHLQIRERNLRAKGSRASLMSRRISEHRRMSVIVTLIAIIFLIAELPYGLYILYNIALETVNAKGVERTGLEANRAVRMSYEILLLFSFNANFYIYAFLNPRFRACLHSTFVRPVQKFISRVKNSKQKEENGHEL
ncbi:sex peptide receptor-like [Mercenaria mercenaria]|uniref:sex peptide receptor-like n=1 Tax=Mercenaria mercenaria TaxID=6596 RepID=UPI00234F6D35|nr:sex peptide receptor-like [Mercenaria mercenaria]